MNYHQATNTKNDYIDTFLRQRGEMQVLLKKNLLKAQERMTYYANRHRTERSFEEGDEVFLKTQDFRQNSLKDSKDNKFSARYYGLYKILKKVGFVAYRLQLPESVKIHNTFHVSLLKKKIGPDHMVSTILPPSGITNDELRPAKILDRRLIKKNNAPAAAILVQWEGMVPEDAKWEEYDDIQRRYPWFSGEVAAA